MAFIKLENISNAVNILLHTFFNNLAIPSTDYIRPLLSNWHNMKSMYIMNIRKGDFTCSGFHVSISALISLVCGSRLVMTVDTLLTYIFGLWWRTRHDSWYIAHLSLWFVVADSSWKLIHCSLISLVCGGGLVMTADTLLTYIFDLW